MTFDLFQTRLALIKQDFNNIETKTDDLIKGLYAYMQDINAIPQSWLFDIIENELANLIFAVNIDLADDYAKVKDFIEYYVFSPTAAFTGEISWEGEEGKHSFDLSKDEDVYEYIKEGL